MTAPEGIPQEVWERAEAIGDKAKSPARYDIYIARAIMEERERCAALAETLAMVQSEASGDWVKYSGALHDSGKIIASAIRKGTEK